jgi:hypothetical protein
MLIEKIYEEKAKKIRVTPCHTNRASEAGHACERYLVLRRLKWQDMRLHDVKLQLIFDEGNHQERILLRDLEEAGVQIIEQQRDHEWRQFQLTAHLDGKAVLSETEAAPIECKSMSPHIWEKINSIADLMHSDKPWLQKYPAQIQLYLLLSNSERGFLILKNKSTGELKEIEVRLDLEYAEGILKKLERVNRHVAAGTVPPAIPYDEDICERCPFFQTTCLVEVKRTALELSDDAELAEDLARREVLKPMAAEYDKLDKAVKTKVKGQEKVACGNFLILGKEVSRKGYQVKDTTFWQSTIKPIEEVKS